jgi:hypothetical protein
MDSSAGTHCHQSYAGIPVALASAVVQYMADTNSNVHYGCCCPQLSWRYCQILEGSLVPGKQYHEIILNSTKAFLSYGLWLVSENALIFLTIMFHIVHCLSYIWFRHFGSLVDYSLQVIWYSVIVIIVFLFFFVSPGNKWNWTQKSIIC